MNQNIPIILDCDPGEDDALAILYALKRGLPVKGLICGFGNTLPQNTIKNGAGLLTLANRRDVPLFKGAQNPFRPHPVEEQRVSAGDFVGNNGLCGIDLPVSKDMTIANDVDDERLQLETIAEYIRTIAPITYIVTGPCTTLAHILEIFGTEASVLIKKIIIMGGALDTPGNHGPINPESAKPYAEFNFYCDPHGAARVLSSNIDRVLVPWDLTENIVLGYAELLHMNSSSPIGSFILELMKNFLESYGIAHDRAFEFNDCINLIAYEGRGQFRKERIRILVEGQQAGRIVRDIDYGHDILFFDLQKSEIISTRNHILEICDITVNK